MMGRPIALYVVSIVILSCPHVLPAIDFRALFLCFSLVLISLGWALNDSRASNVTPRILGFLTVGNMRLFIVTFSVQLTSLVHVVNKVTVDFSLERISFLLDSQLSSISRYYIIPGIFHW